MHDRLAELKVNLESDWSDYDLWLNKYKSKKSSGAVVGFFSVYLLENWIFQIRSVLIIGIKFVTNILKIIFMNTPQMRKLDIF